MRIKYTVPGIPKYCPRNTGIHPATGPVTGAGKGAQSFSKFVSNIRGAGQAGASSGRFSTEAQIVSAVKRNAEIANELTRRQVARGRLTNTSPQAFGTRAHKVFDDLNQRLAREMRLDGTDFELDSEVFRLRGGAPVREHARGSIGADVILTSRLDPQYSRVFDLKTHGSTPTHIPTARQDLFLERFGAHAEEIYIRR